MAEQVKVLGTWASPFSCRVEIALKLKGIPYEFVEEDLSNKSPLLLSSNPVHKKIPVLLHNQKPIAESALILEYIDETWKDKYPLLPQDPYALATSRFWAKTIDDKLMPAAWKALTMEKGKEQDEAVEEVNEVVKLLEEELKGQRFFGGESVGYVDVVATLIAFWITGIQEVVGFEVLSEDKFPTLLKWIGELQEVDAVKGCLPPKDQLLEKFRARISAMKLKA